MPEPTKRGRRPAPNPRQKRNLYLTQDEIDELSRRRGNIPEAIAIRQLFLVGLHSEAGRYELYRDSGQADADEAAENAADLAEARAMIERGEVGLGPVTN
jgi:hypothetical protein